jgi:SAM-dependent methyltransferase
VDRETRRLIARTVTAVRELLEEDMARQLEGTFGITHSLVEPEEAMAVLQRHPDLLVRRREIISVIHYHISSGQTQARAVQEYIRETAFTYLNRLVALRLMEVRGLVSESVGRGSESRGFKLFQKACPGLCRNLPDGGYRRYLEMVFDDVAGKVPLLFDRSLPYSLLFPSPPVLKKVLEWLNRPELESIWDQDETIGWFYQFFTPREERERVRKESQAPRDSYEMAIRNQFYTPEYVVRFLTDNTLGRLWYEVNPATSLVQFCRYFIYPEGEGVKRQVKPTEIKILDPACGSGHFLLYAFDLLARIYEEEGYRPAEIPGLILKHNLFGIDIDPRAVQIASLALYLKAKKYHPGAVVEPARVVCAGSMPGDEGQFRKFLAGLHPVLQEIVKELRQSLELAAEAGSLLKPEAALRAVIEKQKAYYHQTDSLFRETAPRYAAGPPPELPEDFWQRAEEEIMALLRRYEATVNGSGAARQLFARQGRQGIEFTQLLRQRYDVVLMNPPFGDACIPARKYIETTYPRTKNDVYAAFVERGLELLKPQGFLGAITSRTGFFLTTFGKWRQEVLLPATSVVAVADLGFGVLDTAMVETAAYVLAIPGRSGESSLFFRLLKAEDKAGALASCVQAVNTGEENPAVYAVDQDTFNLLPGAPFPYWVSDSMRRKFVEFPPFEGNGGLVRQGLATADDFRFVRAAWEVPPEKVGQGKKWVPFAKGGEYSPYYDDIHLVVNWENDGAEIRAFENAYIRNQEFYFRPGLTWPYRTNKGFNVRVKPAGTIHGHVGHSCFIAGDDPEKLLYCLGWFNTRLVECLLRCLTTYKWEVGYVQKLPFMWPEKDFMGQVASLVLKCFNAQRKVDYGHEGSHAFIRPVLLRKGQSSIVSNLLDVLAEMDEIKSEQLEAAYQIDRLFIKLYGLTPQEEGILSSELLPNPASCQELDTEDFIQAFLKKEEISINRMSHGDDECELEEIVSENRIKTGYGTLTDLSHLFRAHPRSIAAKRRELGLYRQEELAEEVANLLMYAVGCAFGRWDVRVGRRSELAPALPGPFDPLPACAPATLVGPDGLPATSGRIVSEEWLQARPDAITLPPAGQVQRPVINDDEYPIPVAWDGVLVDDPGHPADIVDRVRRVLAYLFDDPGTVEQEACTILGVKDLRSWLAGKFFSFHIKRYSKSRRKAPIYWQLRSYRKNYSVWLYYHRLTGDTLFHVLRTYIGPKIQYEERKLAELQEKLTTARGGREERALHRRQEEQKRFLEELLRFRDDLTAVAHAGYEPDLDDGVLINIAPLYRVVPWPDAERTWKELLAGKYPWSKIAQKMFRQ